MRKKECSPKLWQLRDKENNSNMFWALLDMYKEEEEGGGDMWQKGRRSDSNLCRLLSAMQHMAYLTELHWH